MQAEIQLQMNLWFVFGKVAHGLRVQLITKEMVVVSELVLAVFLIESLNYNFQKQSHCFC